MKFAIMGDAHFDFWLDQNFKEKHFNMHFREMIEAAPADVLLIPGDIGHYNAQNINCLKLLRQHYERIVVTFGNHDYDLVTHSVRDKYRYRNPNRPSEERVSEMKQMIEEEEGIDYVDGNVIDIKGVRVGGATGWYDGSLLMNNGRTYDEVQWEWRLQMNDANLIYPRGNNDGVKFDRLFQEQQHRLDEVYQQCDIMMTHVSPLSEWNQFAQMYHYQKPLEGFYKNYTSTHEALQDYRAFYCFDGKKYLEEGSMKHWVFGHTHRNFHRAFERAHGGIVDIHCNSIGYPKNRRDKSPEEKYTIQVIDVEATQ